MDRDGPLRIGVIERPAKAGLALQIDVHDDVILAQLEAGELARHESSREQRAADVSLSDPVASRLS